MTGARLHPLVVLALLLGAGVMLAPMGRLIACCLASIF
jgi:predicted PurR-regulated permease PerM